MQTLLAFLIAILLLVSLHELGHLIVARLCGVKVLRFSVGFGKPFFTKKWRNIEWCLAPIPLGGYVKMVDTREGKVEPADLPFAFDKQHPLKRIAVVVAGPLTNLVLAVLLYCLSFSIGGVTELRPLVGTVYSPSIAARSGFVAGDRIISVNGKSVDNFADAQTEMILNLEAGKVLVDVETADGQHQTRVIDAAGSADATTVAKRQTGIGLSPFKISDNIGMVQPNSPAQKAGLQKGDKIISINQTQTATWEDWSQIVRQNAGRSLNLVYLRNGKEHTTQITPTPVQEANQTIGRVGLAAAMDEEWAKQVRYHYTPSFSQSLQLGWQKTVHYSTLTLSFFGKLVTGNAS